MRDERIQVILPDNTKLIAEAETNTNYPSINITYEDADGNVDEVAFAEYNQGKRFGKKVQVGKHQMSLEESNQFT